VLDEDASTPDAELPADVIAALDRRGITARDEAALRRAVERHLHSFTLIRLMPAAARRWKCRYRIMFGDTYCDCQTVPEAYARTLLAVLEAQPA
jgi:hypothetical protein